MVGARAWKGMPKYVKGGIAVMSKMRSKHRLISFTTIVTSPAKFDMKGHLTEVSIDLDDEDLLGMSTVSGRRRKRWQKYSSRIRTR